jgi:hypothetical protein
MAGSRLPELDVERVRRWCRQRVPEHLRDQIRVECDAGPGHLTIVECRPPWRKDMGPGWTRFCATSGGGSTRDAAQTWAIGLAVAAAQSWRVSMNTGNCRVVLAWCSPRVGYSATSFGHSWARAEPASSSARIVNVWAPTSTVIWGLALRL